MSKLQKYLCAGVLVLVLAGIGWQYHGWQKQVERHENALRFWQVEVPRIQKQVPNPKFKPQDSKQMIAAENKQFEQQKKAPYINSGIIIVLGVLATGAIIYVPKIIPKITPEKQPNKKKKK